MTTSSPYVFDPAWERELERLRSLERLFDAASQRHLAARGVTAGWRCLELGCGAGSLAVWLADLVGPTGSVLATDLDTRFLEGHGRANLEMRRHNIVRDPLEPASFDLIHARAVIEHIPEREQALAHLVEALKPGGWMVIEDTDYGGLAAAMIGRYCMPTGWAALAERFYLAAETLLAMRGAQGTYGPRLPAALTAAGLEHVIAEVHAPLLTGGTSGDWVRLTAEQIRWGLVASGQITDAEVAEFLDLTADGSTRYLPPFMVTAWGRRADTSP
jgi:SAM-dependent methyltransferase